MIRLATFIVGVALGAILLDHPLWVVAALVLYAARRSSLISLGVLRLCRVRDIRPWHARLLPGAVRYVMSDDGAVLEDGEPVRTTGSSGSHHPVRAHRYQVEPEELNENEPPREPLILHNLSRASLIAMLAVQQDEKGNYRFSKNQIVELVGGTRKVVLSEIDEYRATTAAPVKRQMQPMQRPTEGW